MTGKVKPSEPAQPPMKKQAPSPPPQNEVAAAMSSYQTRNLGPGSPPPHYGATHQSPSMSDAASQNITVVIARKPAEKSLFEAYLLWFPLGILGFHHFYLRRYGFGFLYLFTLGLFGLGWLYDLVRMPGLVRKTNRKIAHPEEKEDEDYSLMDAYMLWFPLGFFGLHHFYLHRPGWGVAYMFTLGLFGVGWIIDAFRMPSLVKEANVRRHMDRSNTIQRHFNVCDAYALGATPVGIFGTHHFYLRRWGFGVYYLLTLGGGGIGWICDWFRIPVLVHRANNPYEHLLGKRHKQLDDAYIMAFPFGFLGLHHFYLERYCWGVLYLCTLGLFGIGWLVDLVRMPCLVSDTNERLQDEIRVLSEIQEQLGGQNGDVRRKEVVIFPATNNGNDNGQQSNQSSFVEVQPIPGPMSETPILQPPSYDHSMNHSGYHMPPNAFIHGNPPPPAYNNYGFEKQEQLPPGHQFV